MNPIFYIPINIPYPIKVYEQDGKIIVLNEKGQDVTGDYKVEIKRSGSTETVVVRIK